MQNAIEIYRSPDGSIQLDVKLENETVWLTQSQMTELFGKDQSVIARHITNAFKEKEVTEESNMQILHNTQFKYRPTKVYSLDVIISVGYRAFGGEDLYPSVEEKAAMLLYLVVKNHSFSDGKEKVLAVARGERTPESPEEIIKDPMVLEFLGLERKAAYYQLYLPTTEQLLNEINEVKKLARNHAVYLHDTL